MKYNLVFNIIFLLRLTQSAVHLNEHKVNKIVSPTQIRPKPRYSTPCAVWPEIINAAPQAMPAALLAAMELATA